MNWIVRYCLILIFLCGISTGKSQDVFHQADSLFMAGEFHQAGLAYEWIIYSGTTPGQEARAVLGRVQSFKKLSLFDQAGRHLDQVNIFELPDSMRVAIIYETLLVNYLSGNYQEVLSRFLMARPILQKSDFHKDSKLIQCLSQMKSGQWALASISAESFIELSAPPEKADSLITQFYTLFDTLQSPRFKNPKTARILSMIIPGSGQVYSGYLGDGLISFSLHLLALSGAGFAFSQGLFITGWIGGFGLLQKLYFGGIQRAAELSEQKSRLNKEIFIQPASAYLLGIAEMSN